MANSLSRPSSPCADDAMSFHEIQIVRTEKAWFPALVLSTRSAQSREQSEQERNRAPAMMCRSFWAARRWDP